MLVFIDESGDTGLKLSKGSSRFFVISLVIFDDHNEATACEKSIEKMVKQSGLQTGFVFHFADNSHPIRLGFLNTIRQFNFSYYGIVINKAKLTAKGFQYGDSFYKFATNLVFQNCKAHLKDAIIIIDRSGKKYFRNQLSKYLQGKINTKDRLIKKVKMQPDRGNYLLQLADYVAGIINRCEQGKKSAQIYSQIIAHNRRRVQVWPPK